MEVLRDLRPLGRLNVFVLDRMPRWALGVAALALATVAGCATGGAGEPLGNAPTPGTPITIWPVKTREHVDLWLHGFALLQDDTATVPLFARDYRERMTVRKNARSAYTPFDAARDSLAGLLAKHRDPLGLQFLALYFGTWEEMVQATEYFVRANGDPNAARDAQVKQIVAFLASNFPSETDRAFFQRLMAALTAEREQFYHAWWLEEQRTRATATAKADSLWQSRWRPALQRFLNNTQQSSGDLVLALTLGGEGRAVPAGRNNNQYAVTWPAHADSVEVLLYAFAHEVIGSTVQTAVMDNLTPAETRAGAATPYLSAGLVRGGAVLVEHVTAGAGVRYARWYLAQAGRPVPASDAAVMTAFEAAFPMRPEMMQSIARQVEISFSGI